VQDPSGPGVPGQSSPHGSAAFPQDLACPEEQVRVLRDLATKADPQTRGVLATLAARAQALIATAVVVGSELVGEVDLLPL
jgi:hypothetical protein